MPKKVKKTRERVAVIGLGYVGLPLAVVAAAKGYRVTGIDHNAKWIRQLQQGINPLLGETRITDGIQKKLFSATTKSEALRLADIVILCVPTPVSHDHKPNLQQVIKATQTVAKHLRRGQLIVLESTVNPGVTEEVMLPILEKTGKQAGRDFELAHCPERINPGDARWHLENIPRCLGSTTARGAKRAAIFYRSILGADIRVMNSLKEAEATKIVENSFRDINIAFVNELARSFDALGIDLHQVLQGAATKPFGYLPHWPSIGVGGHCIPVDPYYLIERASQAGFDHQFLRLARAINNGMPEYAVRQLQEMLNRLALPLNGTTIAVLGLSYKANVADTRESPSYKVIELLRKLGARVVAYDPYFPEQSNAKSLAAALQSATGVILAVNHREFLAIDGPMLKRYRVKAIVDGKNCLDKPSILKNKVLYKGIGS